jgi:hypothetical protein
MLRCRLRRLRLWRPRRLRCHILSLIPESMIRSVLGSCCAHIAPHSRARSSRSSLMASSLAATLLHCDYRSPSHHPHACARSWLNAGAKTGRLSRRVAPPQAATATVRPCFAGRHRDGRDDWVSVGPVGTEQHSRPAHAPFEYSSIQTGQAGSRYRWALGAARARSREHVPGGRRVGLTPPLAA